MACKAGSLFPALHAMFFLFNGRNGHHQQPVGVTAWVEHLPSDEVPNKVPTAWDFGFHGLGLRVPRLGTSSSTAWDFEFHGLGLRVPQPGTASSTPWEYEFHAVELSCSCLRGRGALLVKVQIQKKLPEIVSGSFLVSYAL